MVKPETLEKLQREDHDTLIRLEAKVDNLCLDVKELKDGTTQKLINIDTRVAIIEKIHDEINPLDAMRKLEELYQWKHDFHLTWRITMALAAVIGAVISYVLSILKIFK